MPASDFPRANVGFSALRKYAKITPFLPEIRLFLAIIFPFSSALQAKFSFSGSSLNAAVVFNVEKNVNKNSENIRGTQ